MPKLTKTYSANSLKLLDYSPKEYKLKYEEGLFLNPSKEIAKAGERLHSFLCYYLKNFDMTKFEATLSDADKTFLNNIKTFDAVKNLKNTENKDIEQPFLIKCTQQNTHIKDISASQNALNTDTSSILDTDDTQKADSICNARGVFYLTGRFDAILKDGPNISNSPNTPKPATNINTAAVSNNPETKIKIYDWKTQNLPKNPENDIQTIVYLYCASKLYKTQNISITYISLTKNESIEIPYNKDFDYFKRIFDITRKAPA